MADASKIYSVFISHAAADVGLATEVANALRANGLDAVTSTELLWGEDADDALQEAVAESRALVVILSPSGLAWTMALEVGAAWGWNKPIYGIVTDPASTRRPPGLSGVHLYTLSCPRATVPSLPVSTRQLASRLMNLPLMRTTSETLWAALTRPRGRRSPRSVCCPSYCECVSRGNSQEAGRWRGPGRARGPLDRPDQSATTNEPL